jgi:hypothetical protein
MSVRGASRTSFAGLAEQLEAENITSAAVATRLGNELFAVVGLLDNEHGIRASQRPRRRQWPRRCCTGR